MAKIRKSGHTSAKTVFTRCNFSCHSSVLRLTFSDGFFPLVNKILYIRILCFCSTFSLSAHSLHLLGLFSSRMHHYKPYPCLAGAHSRRYSGQNRVGFGSGALQTLPVFGQRAQQTGLSLFLTPQARKANKGRARDKQMRRG